MDGFLAALLLLGAFGSLGAALLRRVVPELTPVEVVAFGGPLGAVAASLALIPLGIVFGIGGPLVGLVGAACAAAAIALWPDRSPLAELGSRLVERWLPLPDGPSQDVGLVAVSAPSSPFRARLWVAAGSLPVLAFGLLALRSITFWSGALEYEPDGLWAGHPYIWSDWPLHLANVTSFAYGDNFPPENPHLVGLPWSYHYLTSLTAAAMVEVGMTPAEALDLHSLVFSLLYAVGAYVFAQRLTGRSGAAILAVALFLLGGGLGWILRLTDAYETGDFWGSLRDEPWQQQRQDDANYEWQNTFFSLLAPQRAFLYGLPLALLTLTLLQVATRSDRRPPRLYLMAGLVAGLLPLADLGALLALALITPFLVLLFPGPLWKPFQGRPPALPSPRWALFFAAWVLVAAPQLYAQHGGGRGPTGETRLQVGWVAEPDHWFWFWVKNLGVFVPLLLLAFADRSLLPAPARRFLWGTMPLFVVGNLVVLQPWAWNNTKFLIYWFLAVCILVAALLAKLWQAYPRPAPRSLLVAAVLAMTLSGIFPQVNNLAGKDRFLLFSAEDLAIAAAIRAETPPDAVFAVAARTNQPVPALTGRQVVMGYPGWLSSYGFDLEERYRDLRAIFALAPEAPALMAMYGVDYVVIGPLEREFMGANETAFRARYPVVIATPGYNVFAVGN